MQSISNAGISNTPKKVYLAGPQVFLKDAIEWFASATTLCAEYNLTALVPYGMPDMTPRGIFEFNKNLIEEADYVVADVTCFRGTEPDSGTAWEIGYAHGKGKTVVMYAAPETTVSIRRRTLIHFGLSASSERDFMPDGMCVENFGSPVNLMLSETGTLVLGSLKEAIEKLPIGR